MPKDSIVYTGGTFDLTHAGHATFLKQCSQLGKVIVALNTDKFIQTYKGSPPILSYKERETILKSIKYVHKVVPNTHGADSKPAIELVKPDIIAIGSDWAEKDYYKQMGFTQQWLNERHISLIYIPYTAGISTTELKKRIRESLKI